MPSLEQIKQTDWFKERPQIIKDLICRFPYAASVKIKSTNKNGFVYSWSEEGTIKVVVTEKDNPSSAFCAAFGNYVVFGLKPEDLEFVRENHDLIIDDESDIYFIPIVFR